MQEFFKYYLIYLSVMTLITFFLYVYDKSQAKRGAWRIKEIVLLSFSFFGGALGGFIAMNIYHHKTKHWYFVITNILGIVLHSLIIYFVFLK